MSLLTDGSIAAAIFGATNDLLMSDVTYRPSAGAPPVRLRGMVGQFSSFRRAEFGIPDEDVQITLLQHKAPAEPVTGGEIETGGKVYTVLTVSKDPASATWEVHARPA